MKTIDLTKVSYHVINDRQTRFDIIENTVGWGETVYQAQDLKDNTCVDVLTSTGVYAVIDAYGMLITAWVASVKQATTLYKRATKQEQMPKALWNMINYNNNTALWQKLAA